MDPIAMLCRIRIARMTKLLLLQDCRHWIQRPAAGGCVAGHVWTVVLLCRDSLEKARAAADFFSTSHRFGQFERRSKVSWFVQLRESHVGEGLAMTASNQ